jgi:hypothetical protein
MIIPIKRENSIDRDLLDDAVAKIAATGTATATGSDGDLYL